MHDPFYRSHSQWSDPGNQAHSLDAVPANVSAITATVQGLFVHDYFGAHLYAAPPPGIDMASRATLPIWDRLPRLHGYDHVPLTTARHTACRTVGTCRDFALLTCAVLRHHGVGARVRCGFARYFHPPTYEDHWICEYWNDSAACWNMADAQLDREHRQHLSIRFDPDDMPKDQFLFPWQVWEQFGDDPARLADFGHGDARGLWFLRVNLARDLMALAKQEVSPWDGWRDQSDTDKAACADALAQCAALAAAGKRLDRSQPVNPHDVDDAVARFGTPHWLA